MKILMEELMSKHTSFKIGGSADVFAIPASENELIDLIKFLREKDIIYYIVGKGTNLLVSDKGLRGCVVNIFEEMSKITVVGTKILAEAGALMVQLADEACNNNLTGFEPLCEIPGTVGGAVSMNAGAYDTEISDFIVSVDVIDENNKIRTLKKEELDFSYRHSIIEEKGYIVTKVRFDLKEGDEESIRKKMSQYTELRTRKQPLEYPSAGSVFKRPENGFASLLIQESGLQGETVGGAEVSRKHAGFIVNINNATAKDVYKLIQKIQDRVKTYYNINLEPEIKIWGKF